MLRRRPSAPARYRSLLFSCIDGVGLRGRPGRVVAGGDVGPRGAHQPEIEVQVVQGGELRPQHLAGAGPKAQIGARELPADRARTGRIERFAVARMARKANVYATLRGEAGAVPAVAGRQHTIEQGVSHSDESEEVLPHAPT